MKERKSSSRNNRTAREIHAADHKAAENSLWCNSASEIWCGLRCGRWQIINACTEDEQSRMRKVAAQKQLSKDFSRYFRIRVEGDGRNVTEEHVDEALWWSFHRKAKKVDVW